jgi:TPR repeat protein
MNSRVGCRLIFPAMLFCAFGMWAQCSLPLFEQKAIAVLKQQAARGDAAAQCGLGAMYDSGYGVTQDFAQAAMWYRKAANQGDAAAQMTLGVLYSRGTGVPQDDVQAAMWWRKAAEQGEASAQYSLGSLYAQGKGVPQDYIQAAVWYAGPASRVTEMDNTLSAVFTLAAKVYRRTTRRLQRGIERPLSGAMRAHSTALVSSTKMA